MIEDNQIWSIHIRERSASDHVSKKMAGDNSSGGARIKYVYKISAMGTILTGIRRKYSQ